MLPKTRKIKSFTVFYKNEFEIDFLIEEIFNQGCYHFNSENFAPMIVDCGAHIGMSVLYFKSLYPDARIIAFEPDKQSYDLLEKNVAYNNLKGVSLHNCALSDFLGPSVMYGDFSEFSESIGNTMIEGWGDRDGFSRQDVVVNRLSSFLNGENIDYLKIDTEGTELAVLQDVSDSLKRVRNIFVEFHEFAGVGAGLLKVKNLLVEHHFKLDAYRLELTNILAEKYPIWSSRQKPVVHIIKGKK